MAILPPQTAIIQIDTTIGSSTPHQTTVFYISCDGSWWEARPTHSYPMKNCRQISSRWHDACCSCVSISLDLVSPKRVVWKIKRMCFEKSTGTFMRVAHPFGPWNQSWKGQPKVLPDNAASTSFCCPARHSSSLPPPEQLPCFLRNDLRIRAFV